MQLPREFREADAFSKLFSEYVRRGVPGRKSGQRKNSVPSRKLDFTLFSSVPGAIRTRGVPLRRRTLYPTEVRRHIKFFETRQHSDLPLNFPSSAFELRLRRAVLYPAELRRHAICIITGLSPVVTHLNF